MMIDNKGSKQISEYSNDYVTQTAYSIMFLILRRRGREGGWTHRVGTEDAAALTPGVGATEVEGGAHSVRVGIVLNPVTYKFRCQRQ